MPRQVVIDTETTGMDPKQGHRMIEFGCIELIDRKITGNQLRHFCNPQREVDAGAVAVHGITNEFLADKPKFIEVAESILEFIADAELIIHNAPFDLSFLNWEFKLLNKKFVPLEKRFKIIDTLVLARSLHPGKKNNLDALCERYEVNASHRTLHGALLDAELTARVYLAMTSGQLNLFEEGTTAEEKVKVPIPQLVQLDKSVKVILASEKSLTNHNQFLKDVLLIDS